MESRIKYVRLLGIAEGISFLVLLFIAMPLKYFLNMPFAVMVVGWAHGVLFMAYVAIVFYALPAMRWSIVYVMLALIASLLPFGTIVYDKTLKRKQQELAAAKASAC